MTDRTAREVTDAGLERLSLNQATAEPYGIREVVDECARQGVMSIGLWRHKVDELGPSRTARLIRDAGLSVSSLCRGGFFAARGAQDRRARARDNSRALETAAKVGASTLVLVAGPPATKDLENARSMVRSGIEAMIPLAESLGVQLGIEPLHPVFAADRSVIVTLAEANALVASFASRAVGVIVDAYHVWWDPRVYAEVAAAEGKIIGFHVSDWLVPQTDLLMGRGMMGDGVIDLARLRAAVDGAGYQGPIEVEIFNKAVWEMDLPQLVALVRRRFREVVCLGSGDGPGGYHPRLGRATSSGTLPSTAEPVRLPRARPWPRMSAPRAPSAVE